MVIATTVLVLAVRADGHVGLRAQERHAEALRAYVALLRAPAPGIAAAS